MATVTVDEVFQYYVYPTVYIIIFSVGVPSNGALFLMFLRNRSLRNTANIMVFNLVLADIMNIFTNMPLFYLAKYHSEIIYLGGHGCRMFVFFRFLNQAVIELSVLILSIQRYVATRSIFQKIKLPFKMSKCASTYFFISSVWILASMLSLPCAIVFYFFEDSCFPIAKSNIASKALDIFYFVIFCFIIPIPLLVLSLLTSWRLKKSVKLIPGVMRNSNREETRHRSARVVTALAIAFALTHVPRSIWFFVYSYFHLNSKGILILQYIDEITNYLLLCHSIVNPIALYIASSNFRKMFNKYLFCCLFNDERQKDLELSQVTQYVSEISKTSESLKLEFSQNIKPNIINHSL